MSTKNYLSVTAVIFLIVGAVHIVRALNGWMVAIDTWVIPVAASWVGAIIALFLAWTGYKLSR
jgi:hypothetical protein